MIHCKVPVGSVAFMGGVPANLTDFTRSWGRMISYTHDYALKRNETIYVYDAPTSEHSSARNYLARTFLGDWLMMFDLDHAFEPDILARLLAMMKKHDLPVLGALYQYRNPPHMPNLFWWSPRDKAYVIVANPRWDRPLMGAVGLCMGAGSLLVHRSTLDAVRERFECEPFELMPSPVKGKNFSEDYSFFERLRLMGVPAYVSPVIHSYHLRVQPTRPEDYDMRSVEVEEIGPIVPETEEAVEEPQPA